MLWSLPVSLAATLTHGPSVAEVEADHATVWARADGPGEMQVRVTTRRRVWKGEVTVTAETDFTGAVRLDGLRADSDYAVTVMVDGDSPRSATFRTPPAVDVFAPVTLAWGGDLGGQNACRDVTAGYPIFPHIQALKPAFFLALGDLIYADGVCEAVGKYGNTQVPGAGKSATLETYRDHWRYNLDEAGYAALRAAVPVVAVWDDHEVVNDFGPGRDSRSKPPYTEGVSLTPMGLRSFREYNVLPDPLYRSLRWGAAVELIILDTRSYRSPNDAPDDAAKTMLGDAQRRWLVDTVRKSDAAWKIVVSSVPLSAPTGTPATRDGWSPVGGGGGFLTELRGILAELAPVKNLVFLTTDVHYAAAFRYPRSTTLFHEFIAGPLNAGLFPSQEYEASLGTERLFFHGPASMDAVTQYGEAMSWFNFGTLSVEADRALVARWYNAIGAQVGEVRVPAD